MATPAQVVADSFIKADGYAAAATAQLGAFTAALNAAAYAAPSISLSGEAPRPPSEYEAPQAPAFAPIEFIQPDRPSSVMLPTPTIDVGTFTEAAPAVSMPTMPVLYYGQVPVVPEVGAVAIPATPTLTMPNAPEFLALSTVTFGGVDLHEDYLSKFDGIPTLTLVAPTPYSYARGPEYASGLLDDLKATLRARIAGGTSLAPNVEFAIWDRARSRETQLSLANEAEIMRQSEAFGFQLPTGALAAQLREAQKSYFDKLSGLSRDVAIKQAELEQENLKQTIAQGMDMEARLIDYSVKREQFAFDAARIAAENAIQAYNAQVEQYKALLSAYQVYATAYDTIIKGEMAKVDVYKAQLAGEQTKATLNSALAQQYKTAIEAEMSQVEIFKSQISAANSLMQIEQLRISSAGEQIKAYAAQVNAETAKVEAYKAGIQAESVKVEIYKTKASAFASLAGVQAENARAQIALYGATAQAKSAEWDGYRAVADAEKSKVQAIAMQNSAMLDGYKASASASEASANASARQWESSIKSYEANQTLAMQVGKINSDLLIATRNQQADSAKVGAQVYAQLTSSAYGMIHATAGVSGQTSANFNYSGKVNAEVAPIT